VRDSSAAEVRQQHRWKATIFAKDEVGSYDEDEDMIHSLEIQVESVEMVQERCFTGHWASAACMDSVVPGSWFDQNIQ